MARTKRKCISIPQELADRLSKREVNVSRICTIALNTYLDMSDKSIYGASTDELVSELRRRGFVGQE